MVDFAGWDMPVLYTGILEEARAVRTHVGLFDISHMGRIRLSGAGSTSTLQHLTSNDVSALNPSEAQYSLLMNPSGGVIDDIIVYREAEEAYWIVINASNAEKDILWIQEHLEGSAVLEDWSERTAMIAVQGPNAPALTAELTGKPEILSLKRFQYREGEIAGERAIFCRTGYTGEDGFELIVPASSVARVWERFVEAGGVPCGLGARDALRIEAGYPLYGHEIDDSTSPVEAGLMWVVSLTKDFFIGQSSIQEVKASGAKRRLVGFVLPEERMVPRQGQSILNGEEVVGAVTSGVFSPTKNRSIAMGYVDAGSAKTGTELSIEIRAKRVGAVVVPKKSLLS